MKIEVKVNVLSSVRVVIQVIDYTVTGKINNEIRAYQEYKKRGEYNAELV